MALYLLQPVTFAHKRRNTMQFDIIGFIIMVVIGAVIGFIADAIVPGALPGGWIGAALAGIVGSFVGGYLFNALKLPLGPIFYGFAVVPSIIGAIIVALLVRFLMQNSGRRSRR